MAGIVFIVTALAASSMAHVQLYKPSALNYNSSSSGVIKDTPSNNVRISKSVQTSNNILSLDFDALVKFASNEINYYSINHNTYIAQLCRTCPLVEVNKQCNCYYESAGKAAMAIPRPVTTADKDMVIYGQPTPMKATNVPGTSVVEMLKLILLVILCSAKR